MGWFAVNPIISTGYTAAAYAHNPLGSYSSLPQLSPPSYHQYAPAGLGYVDNTAAAAASQLSSFTAGPPSAIRGHNATAEDTRSSYPAQFNLFWQQAKSC